MNVGCFYFNMSETHNSVILQGDSKMRAERTGWNIRFKGSVMKEHFLLRFCKSSVALVFQLI